MTSFSTNQLKPMKYVLFFTMVFSMTTVCTLAAQPHQNPSAGIISVTNGDAIVTTETTLRDAIYHFSAMYTSRLNDKNISLFEKIGIQETSGENLIFCPLSLDRVMQMVYHGTAGETRQQIGDFLLFPRQDDEMLWCYETIFHQIADKPSSVQTADAVFLLDDKITLQKEFTQKAGEVHVLPSTPESKEVINTWYKEKTAGRIPSLLDSLDPQTKLVIGNAVYFKAKWRNPFDKTRTENKPFHDINGKTSEIPMMCREAEYEYYKGEHYAAVRIPYENDLSMLVILPDEKFDFKAFRKNFGATVLGGYEKACDYRIVKLSFPRFEEKSEFDLVPQLKTLGITDAFDKDKSDFSAMVKDTELHIGLVRQKVNIIVNEEGTEAAAATGVGILMKAGAPLPPVEFTVDRPFLYLIQDDATGLVLFIGQKIK